MLHTNSLHTILRIFGHVIQLVVYQFVHKTTTKKFLILKKIKSDLIPRYAEIPKISTKEYEGCAKHMKKRCTICINTLPGNLRIVDPLHCNMFLEITEQWNEWRCEEKTKLRLVEYTISHDVSYWHKDAHQEKPPCDYDQCRVGRHLQMKHLANYHLEHAQPEETLIQAGKCLSNWETWHCCAHGNNFYGYRRWVQKIWYNKITKVHIFKSI